jgi:hypothetical protein
MMQPELKMMIDPEIETPLEPDEAQPPLRRSPGEAFAALAEALAAAEETAPASAPAEVRTGWDGVISRAAIAFSPLAFFRAAASKG